MPAKDEMIKVKKEMIRIDPFRAGSFLAALSVMLMLLSTGMFLLCFWEDVPEEIKRGTSPWYLTMGFIVLVFFMSGATLFLVKRGVLRPLREFEQKREAFFFCNFSKIESEISEEMVEKGRKVSQGLMERGRFLTKYLETALIRRMEELSRTNEELEKAGKYLRLILDTTAESIAVISPEGKCTFCNRSCVELLKYKSAQDLVGKDLHSCIHNRDGGEKLCRGEACPLLEAIEGEKKFSSENITFRKADGSLFDAQCHVLPQYLDGGHVGTVITFADITERRQREEKIRFLRDYDSVTGLLNRRCFEQALRENDREENLPISVIFMDINGLKMVNDTFGHRFGDEMLQKLGKVLKKNCREEDVASRVGGDEFAVLLPRTRWEDAEQIGQRLRTGYAKEKVHSIRCSMALGVETKSLPYQQMEKIMENAERKMYREKSISRRQFGTEAIREILHNLHQKNLREKEHGKTVSRLCQELGKAMGLPETEIRKLRDAGYLHDIGKVALCGQFDGQSREADSEALQEAMRRHPAVGYRILNLADDMLDLAEGVYAHHERWDGQGYPKGIRGKEIPLISRIIAVVENYEHALRKAGVPADREAAVREVAEGAGSKFDPEITAAFVKMMRENAKL